MSKLSVRRQFKWTQLIWYKYKQLVAEFFYNNYSTKSQYKKLYAQKNFFLNWVMTSKTLIFRDNSNKRLPCIHIKYDFDLCTWGKWYMRSNAIAIRKTLKYYIISSYICLYMYMYVCVCIYMTLSVYAIIYHIPLSCARRCLKRSAINS